MKCLRHCIESGIRAYFTAARTLHMAKRAEKARKHDLSVAKIIACFQTKHSDPYTTTTSSFFWEVKDDVETVLPRPRRGHYNSQARSQCLIIRVFWNTVKCRSWCWPTVDIYGHFDTYYHCHCHENTSLITTIVATTTISIILTCGGFAGFGLNKFHSGVRLIVKEGIWLQQEGT